jgi:hypothetical protein
MMWLCVHVCELAQGAGQVIMGVIGSESGMHGQTDIVGHI